MTDEELEAIASRAAAGAETVEAEVATHGGPAWKVCAEDVARLVAEVRRLRAALEAIAKSPGTFGGCVCTALADDALK